MVEDVLTTEDGQVLAKILLTVASCPLKEPLTKDVTSALSRGSTESSRRAGRARRHDRRAAGRPEDPAARWRRRAEIPFCETGIADRVYAIASGKGGWASPRSW